MIIAEWSNGELVIFQIEDQGIRFYPERVAHWFTFWSKGLVDIAFVASGSPGDGGKVFGAIHRLGQAEFTFAEDTGWFNHLDNINHEGLECARRAGSIGI